MGMVEDLMRGLGMDPAGAAKDYIEQIPGVTQPYYQPFIDTGRGAEDVVRPQYDQMSQDPTAFMNALMAGYKPSEGYQFQQEELGRGMSNTAAAGGFSGTPFDQEQQAKMTQGLLSQDQQQYLQNLLGIQRTGLAGEEAGIGRGYDASKGYADILGKNLQDLGGLAGLQQNERGGLFSSIGSFLAPGLSQGGANAAAQIGSLFL
jgi:hypothetical protein